MSHTITLIPDESSPQMQGQTDVERWALGFIYELNGTGAGDPRSCWTLTFPEGPSDWLLALELAVPVPESLRQANVWRYALHEKDGWMVLEFNGIAVACLGGKCGVPATPPLGPEAAVVEFYAKGDLSPLAALNDVKVLHLHELTPTSNFGVLSRLTGLRSLENVNEGEVDDLSPLSGLTALRRLKFLSGRSIKSIAPLADLVLLEELSLAHFNKGLDWSLLSSMKHLKSLTLSDCWLTGVEHLAGLTALEQLNLEGNPLITDLTPLASLTKLRELNLTFAGASDLIPLTGMRRMEQLNLWMCHEVEDLTPLGEMTQLEVLSLRECSRVRDLRPLAHCQKLRSLDLHDCWRVPVEQREAVEADDYDRLRSILAWQTSQSGI